MKWLKDLLKVVLPDKAGEIDQFEIPGDAPAPPAPPTPPVPPAKHDDGALQKTIEQLIAQNNDLAKTIAEMKTRDDNRVKVLEEQSKTEQKARIQKVLDEAVKAQKLPAKNDDVIGTYRGLLEKDFDATVKVITGLPVIGTPPKNADGKDAPPAPPAPKAGDSILNHVMATAKIVE